MAVAAFRGAVMTRALGAFLAVGLLAGCITDGDYRGGGLGDAAPDRPGLQPYGGRYGSYGGLYGSNDPFLTLRAYGYGGAPFRGRYNNDRPFRPSRHVVCDPDDRVCYKNGHPDRSETRDYFGKKAARRVD
jgi:hypothetical protein